MKHFISIVIDNDGINESRDFVLDTVLNTANIGLLENTMEYEIYESENNTQVLSIPIARELNEKQQAYLAKKLANKLFDKGYNNFDIEFSLSESSLNEADPQAVAAVARTDDRGRSRIGTDAGDGLVWIVGNTNALVRVSPNDPRVAAQRAAISQPQAAAPAAAPASRVSNTTPTGGLLRRGNRGEEVKQLQRDLGMTGDEIDGIFGPATERAVRTFQQNSGAKVDGIVGPETRDQIAKYQEPEDNSAPAQTPDAAPEPIDGGIAPGTTAGGPSQLRQRQQGQVDTTAPEVDTTAPEVDTTAPEVDTTAPEVDTTAPAAEPAAEPETIEITTQDQANSIFQNPDSTDAERQAAREFYGATPDPVEFPDIGTAMIGRAEVQPGDQVVIDGEEATVVTNDDEEKYYVDPEGQPIGELPEPSSRLDRAGETPSTGRSTSPVQPIGRMSSARPNDPETGAVVRPGDETNALDAIAQDRETGALPQPPAQDTATPTRSGPTTRGDRRGSRPDPNANAPQPDAQTTVNSPSGDTSGGDSGVNNNATTDPEVSREIPQAPAFGGGERDVNVDTNAPSQAAPSVDPQVAQGVAGTFYQAMKGGTGIGTNKRQIQTQLAGLQNADEFRAAAEAYKDNNERDLFADFYDEMNDRHFNRFVRPELERLGIEIPTRDSFKNESVEPMPKGAFMVEDRAIWRSLYESTHYTNGKPRPRTFITESKMQEVTFDDDDKFFENYGVMWFNEDETIDEAEYQGRKVKLGKPMAGDVKKFKVYVKNPKGNVVKVNFGQKGARIKKGNPERRRSFRARHNCDNPGPRHKARYWSCRKW